MLIEAGLSCGDCGSTDALARYSGGDYCFSCEKWTKCNYDNVVDLSYETAKKKYSSSNTIAYSKPVVLGSLVDCFLKQRHFTDEMIFYYNIRQSLDGKSLIMSDTKNGTDFTFIDIRNLDPNRPEDTPKYISCGSKNNPYFVNRDNKVHKDLVIVEDMLSAMRVGWSNPCIALRGTKASDEILAYIIRLQPLKLILWFDSDEPGQEGAKKLMQKLSWTGIKFVNCLTNRDAKMYTLDEITTIMREHHEI